MLLTHPHPAQENPCSWHIPDAFPSPLRRIHAPDTSLAHSHPRTEGCTTLILHRLQECIHYRHDSPPESDLYSLPSRLSDSSSELILHTCTPAYGKSLFLYSEQIVLQLMLSFLSPLPRRMTGTGSRLSLFRRIRTRSAADHGILRRYCIQKCLH